jgi:hypothetical protein
MCCSHFEIWMCSQFLRQFNCISYYISQMFEICQFFLIYYYLIIIINFALHSGNETWTYASFSRRSLLEQPY